MKRRKKHRRKLITPKITRITRREHVPAKRERHERRRRIVRLPASARLSNECERDDTMFLPNLKRNSALLLRFSARRLEYVALRHALALVALVRVIIASDCSQTVGCF